MGRVTSRTATLAVIEHLLIVLAVLVAAVLRFGLDSVNENINAGILWRASLIGAVLQTWLHYCDLYDLRTIADRRWLIVGLIQALGATSLVLAVLYYWVPSLVIGRGVFVFASVLVVCARRRLAVCLRVAIAPGRLGRASAHRGHQQAAVALARELFERRQEARGRARGVRRSGSGARRHVRSSTLAWSAPSRTFRRSSGSAASIASSSAWQTLAASCRWTSCCT